MTIEILEGNKLAINGYVFKEFPSTVSAIRAKELLQDLLETNNFTFSEAKNSSTLFEREGVVYTCTLAISCSKSSSQQPQPATA